jgi:hypothetical protein
MKSSCFHSPVWFNCIFACPPVFLINQTGPAESPLYTSIFSIIGLPMLIGPDYTLLASNCLTKEVFNCNLVHERINFYHSMSKLFYPHMNRKTHVFQIHSWSPGRCWLWLVLGKLPSLLPQSGVRPTTDGQTGGPAGLARARLIWPGLFRHEY